MIDLHTHSTASDGTLSPEELVALAAKRGLTAIALTDHDTMAGVPAAQQRGAETGVEVVPGVEVSVHSPTGAMHILGYYLRPDNSTFARQLQSWRASRRQRAQSIVVRLNELGFDLTFSQVEAFSGEGSIGRPHVARALREAGVVNSVAEAFERFLRRGRPAFVPREMPAPAEVITLIKSAGGVAVLAHPATLGVKGTEFERIVAELKAVGLEGIEVYWSSHSRAQMDSYARLAHRLGLLVTGGSDFHGDTKPDIQLGSGRRGNVQVPEAVLEGLRERRITPGASRGWGRPFRASGG